MARKGARGSRIAEGKIGLPYFVYILASRPRGAIYVGSTSDLRKRVEQHWSKAVPGHTARYNIYTLVWFEMHDTLEVALMREHRIKRWRRGWKDEMIASRNVEWRDISDQIPL
ncbi:GIY-YIG nuclease family protein [Limibaculum sp. FT325]|uniref:GIY-YIG nuclease family protein n=1 Tax=Thermohalobaculum sediminis TaxID=2939436 RepID=UPI0020BE2B5A|nr:GIY-YIG nuclease family protein [Limibaculum sediminis]MCL5777797.1 GIY-YIG nuclease family protein [Limibaculum sediminis]